ncbi:MAG: type I restriction enzyme HsdR N-terminal domain-containing protein [Nanoarchaeota archaeon]
MDKERTKNKDEHDSIFQRNIQRGIDEGIIKIESDGSKITYLCSRKFTDNFKDPEEKVRASYFCELVLDYDYPKEKIDLEVKTKPDKDSADIVVYEDDELKSPYLIVECKKDGISDQEYKITIDQAFRYANYLRANFASVVAGITKTAFNVLEFKSNEREKNVISDIPKKYGKIPKYKFIKGEITKELKEVSREELIRALEKSHNTVWQGGKLAPTTAFDEVSKILFCKLRDEKTTRKGEIYSFQIGTHESAEEIFKRIDAIYQKAKKELETAKQEVEKIILGK